MQLSPALDDTLTQHCGEVNINLALEGFSWSLDLQQILGSFLFSSSSSKSNLFLRNGMWLGIT